MADDKLLNQRTSRDIEQDNALRKVAFSSLGNHNGDLPDRTDFNNTPTNGSPTGSTSPIFEKLPLDRIREKVFIHKLEKGAL